MEIVDKYVEVVNSFTPLKDYIIKHDQGVQEKVKTFCDNIVKRLQRRPSQIRFRDVNLNANAKANDPIRSIFTSLIDTEKTLEKNEEYLLEFIRIRLFRMINTIEEWRFYRCVMDRRVYHLTRSISETYGITKAEARQLIYTVKIIELLGTASEGHGGIGTTSGKTEDLRDLRFLCPESIHILDSLINNFVESGCLPLFLRVAVVQNFEALEALSKDYYVTNTLKIPVD